MMRNAGDDGTRRELEVGNMKGSGKELHAVDDIHHSTWFNGVSHHGSRTKGHDSPTNFLPDMRLSV